MNLRFCGAIVLASMSGPLLAEGNLAAAPEVLVPLVLNGAEWSMAPVEYTLETGKYYRIHITSDGQEEFAWFAPELFRNAWVNQVVVNDLEVKAADIYSLEFDAAGTFILTFVPIRPGQYDFYVDGYADKGMLGHFMVN